jgi:hypothetical protein
MPLSASVLFHLNLNYSSIEVQERARVVRRCYGPLLDLVERVRGLVLSVEASGHTLERLERLDRAWVARLGELVHAGRVAFVGSGDSQIIGPLVPWSVNTWNQRLGRETYARLGLHPRVALVNEMAWSQGLVEPYLEAGYELLLMEWNNPRRSHPEWQEAWRCGTVWTRSPLGNRLRLAWTDTVLFQAFQRVAHGELEPEEYVARVLGRDGEGARHVFLYASDAEVFDHRPGRYRSEAALAPGQDGARSEWDRIARLLSLLGACGVRFVSPASLLDEPGFAPVAEVVLTSAADPIPVKKQPKYNVTRWALSGHDDVGINARCFARARELEDHAGTPRDWKNLCRALGSDLRTHLTEKRWRAFRSALPPAPEPVPCPPGPPLRRALVEERGRRLRVATDGVELVLLPRRGLAIESLAFPGATPAPLVGTLAFGHFEAIEWAADFYSGHSVLEIPARLRITDLESVVPRLDSRADAIDVAAEVSTPLGLLEKRVRVGADRVQLSFGFARLGERPAGSLRAAHLTLLEGGLGEPLWLECANGGPRERFELTGEFDHGAAVSPLVSARAALGATDGRLVLDDGQLTLELSWPKERAAALPLITRRIVDGKRFLRIAFSLAEIDETLRPGAPLHDFELTIRAARAGADELPARKSA